MGKERDGGEEMLEQNSFVRRGKSGVEQGKRVRTNFLQHLDNAKEACERRREQIRQGTSSHKVPRCNSLSMRSCPAGTGLPLACASAMWYGEGSTSLPEGL